MANAKPDDTAVSIPITRTELVWPGKYNPDGTLKEPPRVNLPFQVIERVNETRATREAKKGPQELSLFDVWEGDEGDTFDDGWRNKLIWGDNLLVMSSLLEKFAGKIDLIYIDPPFATGADFGFAAEVGSSGVEIGKEQSVIEEKAYRDTWGYGRSSYLSMMSDRLTLVRELLAPEGSLLLHCDYRMTHLLSALCDELLGSGDRESSADTPGFRNEVIWLYGLGGSSPTCYPKKHDTILWYTRGSSWYFRPPMVPATSQRMKGQLKKAPDYWDIPSINNMADERTGYPTQKPEALLERIVDAHTKPGDLVADFFAGSGTTAAVAEKLGRRWIACDLSRWAIHVTRKRLLDLEGGQPFEVLNLGRYERQYWQGVTFGEDRDVTQQALFEYLAFILRLYGAEPVSGLAHLHGKKGKAMVHIGSVDSPVTIDEIDQAISECAELNQTELHILGWEWEMGLYELMVEEAKKRGVKLLLLQIPREVMEQQAADKGDVQFFELAHLEFDVDLDGRTASVTLTDFVIPNTELIPEEVREKIDKWSDYIDYWAIDWDFRDDTFMQGWVAYRTRKNRKLELTSDPHTYEEPGTYTIVVKVIDIFGNDTSQAYELQVD